MRELILWLCLCALLPAQEAIFKVYDKKFSALINTHTQPKILYSQGLWLEGPQVLPNGDLVVSDVEGNEVLLFQRIRHGFKMRVLLKPSHHQNGHALDPKGHLVAVSHGNRDLERLENKHWQVLASTYHHKKFNSPNDVIVDRQGNIYFSDPKFGLLKSGQPAAQEGEFVYRYNPKTKQVVRLNTPLLKSPNGLALSPDEKILYIADSQLAYNPNDSHLKHQVLAYNVSSDKSLHNGRVFAVITPGFPDGIKVDSQGNLWVSNGHGIQVFNPQGNMLGEIIMPQVVSNLAFDLKTSALFVTSDSKLYMFDLKP
ncbi:SMP-30/gluconolactonase/LRE family protein [Helicobacter bizzozeronii]|uniref:SMP-30/gluconolactonase/LRE family protein n=1 Tax=Helicobacter bizzozeronii TaxID=56877 RepID=UPI000CEE196F|nr:SMP-30/gluconolactonase/LRE family protein [Helicobacter bizzozeronii]